MNSKNNLTWNGDKPLQSVAWFDTDNPPAEPWEEVAPGLIKKTAGGLQVAGRTSLRLYFRPLCRTAVKIETHMTASGNEPFMCTAGGYAFYLGGAQNPGAKITLDHWPLAVTGKFRLTAGAHCILCIRMDGMVALALDGQMILRSADPRAKEPIPDLEYFLPENHLFNKVLVSGQAAKSKGIPLRNTRKYNLYMCVDFFDDMIAAPWTIRTLRATMEIYRQHKIKRIYLIDHGGFRSGFWDHYDPAVYPVAKHARETFENIGECMPAFVRAGHQAGLDVYAVYKPQECGMPMTYPHGSGPARRNGKTSRLDGMMWWVMDFVARHPAMRLERDMRPVPPDLDRRVIGKIALAAEQGLNAAFDPQRIRLWVSADNGAYVPYAGPLKIRAANHEIILDGLALKEKFLALTVAGAPTHSFGNVLRNLVKVYDRRNRVLPISFAGMLQSGKLPFDKAGFIFDYPTDTVSEMDNYHWLDSGKPLGIAKGWEQYLCGVLCEAYPEVQQYWMDNIEYYINCGVDGVDIRDLVHTRAFDWDAFGFNPPLVEAFRQKHGVDILNQPFQRADLRRLRGEYYLAFLRQARRRLKDAGKKTHLHLSWRMKSPDWHTELDMHQDWGKWLRAGLADELTMKMSWLSGEVPVKSLAMADKLDLPVNYCPYMNGVFKNPNARAIVSYFAGQTLKTGMAGYIIYENAALMKARPDGHMEVLHPWALDILKQYART